MKNKIQYSTYILSFKSILSLTRHSEGDKINKQGGMIYGYGNYTMEKHWQS